MQGADFLASPDMAASPGTAGRSTAYRPDLDGLRAIAVGLVMLAHSKWPVPLNGGDAGVTAFFVLSGFLITNLLVSQQERTGRIDVVSFYKRRFVRLAPALGGLLVFTLVIGLALGLHSQWAIGIVSCLVYVSNWAQVAGFPIDPLGHTWSLAIEEQFYLVWPAILILFRGRVVPLAIGGIVAMTALRIVSDGVFEYFSTITRADAVLVGCVVAFWRPRWPSWVGLAGLGVLVVLTPLFPEHDIALPLSMAATVAIIASPIPQLGFLAAAGRRAYSLYLWNWPMTLLFGERSIVAVAMTILVAEISYRLLEAPVMRRGGRRVVAGLPRRWVASAASTDALPSAAGTLPSAAGTLPSGAGGAAPSSATPHAERDERPDRLERADRVECADRPEARPSVASDPALP
jgi:peptidoglycan/LPS O-acetylase OafA/YrhL